MEKEYNLTISEEYQGKRIDGAISTQLTGITRSALQKHLVKLLVNGKKEKLSYKCRTGDTVFLILKWEDTDLKPEKIDLDIIYEDENYIIINKEAGMVVHPAQGNWSGTLVNALLGMNKELGETDDEIRPGIVHRIDKDTSGLIVTTKNSAAHSYLAGQFKERKVSKEYLAIVKGFYLPSLHTIENNIGRDRANRKRMAVVTRGGKQSISIVEVKKHFKNYSLVSVKILTGRTHQIRVHLSSQGFPILGDPIYSRKDNRFPEVALCLVASHLSFFDTFSQQQLDFTVEVPDFFKQTLERLENENL